jgi:hypothetical protein
MDITITGLQGNAVAPTAPVNKQSLVWNSTTSQWTPASSFPGQATLTTPVTVTNSEISVLSTTVPANTFQVGTTYRITAHGEAITIVNTDSFQFKLRIGPTTLTGSVIVDSGILPLNSFTGGAPFKIESVVTVTSIGSSANGIGSFQTLSSGPVSTGFCSSDFVFNNRCNTSAFNSTVSNLVELTALTTAATSSFKVQIALIELVKP